MSHPKQRHGNHTWDRVQHYYQCDKCGYVFENRDKFEPRYHRLVKQLACPRCSNPFTVEKKTKPVLGPIFGHDTDVDE